MSYLVLKPLQIQTLRDKYGWEMACYVPLYEKVGRTCLLSLPPNIIHGYNHIWTNILLPETQQHGLTKPFS